MLERRGRTVTCVTLMAVLLVCHTAPSTGDTEEQATYDQRQQGDLNVHVHVQDIGILALLDDSVFGEYGQYDYSYDYQDPEDPVLEEKPSSNPGKPSTECTTSTNLTTESDSSTETASTSSTTSVSSDSTKTTVAADAPVSTTPVATTSSTTTPGTTATTTLCNDSSTPNTETPVKPEPIKGNTTLSPETQNKTETEKGKTTSTTPRAPYCHAVTPTSEGDRTEAASRFWTTALQSRVLQGQPGTM